MIEITRVNTLSYRSFIEDFAIPRLPVVIEDSGPQFAKIKQWNWDFFKGTYGDLKVVVTASDDKKSRIRLKEYISYCLEPKRFNLENKEYYYLSNWNYLESIPELSEDYKNPLQVNDWFSDFPLSLRPEFQWIFMGPQGSGSKMHIDTSGTDAWLTQIQGRKRWFLFAPEDLPSTQMSTIDMSHDLNVTHVDTENPIIPRVTTLSLETSSNQ